MQNFAVYTPKCDLHFLFLGKMEVCIEGMARLRSALTIAVITTLIIGDRAICQSAIGPGEVFALLIDRLNPRAGEHRQFSLQTEIHADFRPLFAAFAGSAEEQSQRR